jgi:cytochrome c oxidase subunit 4
MTDHAHAEDHGLAHVMPIWILIATFLALIALTVLTVASSYFTLGNFELVIAMGVATAKAVLVAVFFMHLRHDNWVNILFVTFSLAFVALFIGLTLADVDAYQPEIEAFESATQAP